MSSGDFLAFIRRVVDVATLPAERELCKSMNAHASTEIKILRVCIRERNTSQCTLTPVRRIAVRGELCFAANEYL